MTEVIIATIFLIAASIFGWWLEWRSPWRKLERQFRELASAYECTTLSMNAFIDAMKEGAKQ